MFSILSILILISAILGVKVAIETPEEMHLKKVLFLIQKIINVIIILLMLYALNDLFMIVVVFFYYIMAYIQEEFLSRTLVKHKDHIFYKLYPFGNYLFILVAILTYLYYADYYVSYLSSILMLIMIVIFSTLETYFEIRKRFPRTKFTTETTFTFTDTSKWYVKALLRYLPLSIATLFLNILISLKL